MWKTACFALILSCLAGPAWPGGGWPDFLVRSEQTACRDMLKNFDIKWTQQQPLGRQGGCGAPAPIEVSNIDGVDIAPSAIITCGMAAALHKWISGALQPGSREVLGTSVVTIHTAASYVCRSRNNVNGAKLSEHAKANALDLSGFSFAKGKAMTVEDSWGGLLGPIRLAACKSFTTVLGPGSDAYHGNHLHLDVLARKNGYRICQ